MKTTRMRYNLMLLLAAFIWGSAFVAQSVGNNYIGPFAFLSIRAILASIALLPVIYFKRDKQKPNKTIENRGVLLKGGILCGLFISASSLLQQYGIGMTTVGKAGFLTSMYILIVPIFGLFLKKKVSLRIWICIGIEVIGLYLLCMTESFYLSKGDTFEALCAVTFAIHILLIDYFASKVDPIQLSCVQFFVSFIVCGVGALLFEHTTITSIMNAAIPLLYMGFLSGGVAFTLQIVAQQHTKPTIACLIMSSESVFSLFSGMVVLHEIPTIRESIGCIIMFSAIIISQLPSRSSKEL